MARQSTAANSSLLDRWARFSHRRRGRVMLAWVLILVGAVAASQLWGGQFATSFELPGSESNQALDLLEERFPAQAGTQGTLVFEAPGGFEDAEVKARIETLLDDVRAIEQVTLVQSPYENPQLIAPGGTIARAPVSWAHLVDDVPLSQIEHFVDLADEANNEKLRVEAGGDIVSFSEQPEFGSEIYGLTAAALILFIAFGTVIAVGLPIGAAVFGLGLGFAVIGLGANVLDFPEFSPQFAAMIGIGVGIDYSLLVVTRFREGLHTGRNVEEALVLAVTTSGRAVIFAGIVVAIAFLGLYAMGLPFVAAMGTAGAIVVAVAVLVALTLMPAVLSLAGTRIDRWHVPFLHNKEGVDPESSWYRLSVAIQRRPLVYFVASSALLIGMATPVLDMRLGFSDAGNNEESLHSRRAYDLLAKGFGDGFNGPLVVVADAAAGGAAQIASVADSIRKTAAEDPSAGIAFVAPPNPNEAGDTAVITVMPASSPQDSETTALVHRLRDEILPPLEQDGLQLYVSGATAATIDVQDRITDRLPLLFGGVIGLSFILLMTVFRSVFVAAKAAIMNLLSIGASYGVLVAVFQWGWLGNVVGVSEGPIEVFLPMMLFAILFGLSMDYEVFLISRIREEYLITKENATAVSHGLAATARVITAAAAIMVAVFIAFAFAPDRVIKEFGIGLATAIFIDATVVRLLLVPSTMELLGDLNWWLPKWLDRILPNVHLEAPADLPAAGVHASGD